MNNLYSVANKWWKQWYAGMSENDRQNFRKEVDAYELDLNDVMIEMMKIRNDIFKE